MFNSKEDEEKNTKAIFKRLSYSEFCEQYPDIWLDSDWWKGYLIDVYEQDVEIHQTIDLNTDDVFDNGVAKIFLQNLKVHGNIENRNSDYGTPILVVGDVQANAIVAGGAYLDFGGKVTLKDLLIMFYNDGHLEMGKSLEARAVFVVDDHSYSPPVVTMVDYYWDHWTDKSVQIKKERLRTEGLVETFPGASWIEAEEYERDGKMALDYHVDVSGIAEDIDNFGAFCDRLESHYPAAKGDGEEE